ncbi:MAG: hypothetical protein ACYDH5_01785 [Acidimicrobiales bacterium]
MDRNGVTGHSDHAAATAAALAVAAGAGLPVLEWSLPGHVVETLTRDLGVALRALSGGELIELTVDRAGRWARPDAAPGERAMLLEALIDFAVLTDVGLRRRMTTRAGAPPRRLPVWSAIPAMPAPALTSSKSLAWS